MKPYCTNQRPRSKHLHLYRFQFKHKCSRERECCEHELELNHLVLLPASWPFKSKQVNQDVCIFICCTSTCTFTLLLQHKPLMTPLRFYSSCYKFELFYKCEFIRSSALPTSAFSLHGEIISKSEPGITVANFPATILLTVLWPGSRWMAFFCSSSMFTVWQ